MARPNYNKKLERFLDEQSDLVAQYDNLGLSAPTDFCGDDLIASFQALHKTRKTLDFNKTLLDAFTIAIDENISVFDAFPKIAAQADDTRASNSIQQYFKEINEIYTRNNNKYDIEYTPENRDKLIEMNLKAVISVAKKYQGLGLSLGELISAGNVGLVTAWDKFDPSRSKAQDEALEAADTLPETFSKTELDEAMKTVITYGSTKDKFDATFKEDREYTKTELKNWISKNIYNAKFNSIATMWIRAYILIEIDNYSRLVKKPKAEIYKDREEHGSYKREAILDIDAPVSGESDTTFGDILQINDETPSDLEVAEAYDTYKRGLNKLLDGVKSRDRSIFLKKFGIGLPRPMSPREIASQEGLSIARVSQIFQSVVEIMQKNAVKFDIDPQVLLQAAKQIQ